MTTAELFIQCLKEEGVKYIFGVPGEENEDFLLALAKAEGIEFIPTRHEQGAAFIANVIGRLTGKAGVCLSTLGPGATNMLTGVADANLDKSPVVAITGQGGMDRIHHESHQMIDVLKMYEPITRWNTTVQQPAVLPEIVRKAFKLAEMEKPAATHIELPEDIAAMPIKEELFPIKPRKVRRPNADEDAIRRAIHLLKDAQKPIILAGNGAIRKRSSQVLTEFAKFFNYPVISTFMGKGAISDEWSHSLGTIGLGFKDYIMEAVEEADLVLAVGYDIAEYPPEKWNSRKDNKVIHIDFTPAEVYEHYKPEVEIVGDIAYTLRILNQQIRPGYTVAKPEKWFLDIRDRIQEDIRSYALEEGDEFTVPGVLNMVREILAKDGLVISDVGAHKMWIARNFQTYCPNGCLISNGLASMGISLPGGIAAKMINPERQVISMMGDGGALMNIQELETAYRLGLGYTIIIFNDNDYGLIRWKQEMSKGKSAYTRLGNPDFKLLAESFGIKGFRPTTVSELKQILESVILSQQLAIVEIPVSAAVNGELVEKLDAYWAKK